MEEVTYRTVVEHPYRDVAVEKRLLLDPNAESAVIGEPAFASRPPDAKPYHGFALIPSTLCDGYCFGAVTDYLEADSDAGCTIGDGFVQAPDGKRAGIIWGVEPEPKFGRIAPPDDNRWGVYYCAVLWPIKTEEDLVRAFAAMVPVLKRLHTEATQ